ncbi:hypothetical protein BHE74_00057907, partial [Ensete ventricosum]
GDADYLRYRGMQEFDQAMQHLEEKYGFMTSDHQYISRMDEGDKMIVFEGGDLVFVFNFHWTNSYFDYRVGCLKPGKYKVCKPLKCSFLVIHGNISLKLESSEARCGYLQSVKLGDQDGSYDNRPRSFLVYAPSRTVVVYALSED